MKNFKKIFNLNLKKFIPSIAALLFISFTFSSSPPGWFIQYTPTNGRLINDISFLDSLNGWAITDDGTAHDTSFILRTTNGGNNWIIESFHSGLLRSLFIINSTIGYAAGGTGDGLILKTTNGGMNWYDLGFKTGINYKEIKFISEDTGWVCDDIFGGLWKTTNGGLTWITQAGGDVSNIFFIDENTGWFSRVNSLYKTTNGGDNWNGQQNFNSTINDIFFINADTGWITGGGLGTGIAKTINGGLNWFPQSNPGATTDGKFFFLGNKRGWLGSGLGKILVCLNNGTIWGVQQTINMFFRSYVVSFVDTLTGWGGTDAVIHTTDGGGPITFIGIQGSETFIPAFELYQNYPNPFNPKTKIKFELLKNSTIELTVYDLTGKEIVKLIDGEYYNIMGTYEAEFDAERYGLSTGVYLYTVKGTTQNKKEIFIDTKKMMLIK